MKAKYGIIVLAAGGSSRLGKPKQLLNYHRQSLVKHVVEEARLVGDSIVLVVTGADSAAVERELDKTGATICRNNDWQTGMSSSIRTGLNQLREMLPEAEGCILTVCDQPFITRAVLENLIRKHGQHNTGIVASEYSNTAGTPALFSSRYFDELLSLQGDEGAKKLFSKHASDVSLVPFEKGEIDIDTEEDYLKLK